MARVDHGAYRFEDTGFQAWVAARRTVDSRAGGISTAKKAAFI
jgi:hypothetical protein